MTIHDNGEYHAFDIKNDFGSKAGIPIETIDGVQFYAYPAQHIIMNSVETGGIKEVRSEGTLLLPVSQVGPALHWGENTPASLGSLFADATKGSDGILTLENAKAYSLGVMDPNFTTRAKSGPSISRGRFIPAGMHAT